MTSGQCLYEMQPLTVWTAAGQDRDTTSRLKEELPSGTAGRGTRTPRSVINPEPAARRVTSEVHHESRDGGTSVAELRVAAQPF